MESRGTGETRSTRSAIVRGVTSLSALEGVGLGAGLVPASGGARDRRHWGWAAGLFIAIMASWVATALAGEGETGNMMEERPRIAS
jgi:hypothetical protein